MRVLVLGGSGFIGKAIVQQLTECDFDVLAPSSTECNLLSVQQVSNYLATIPEGIRVVFCAAVTREREDSPQAMWKNIQMVANFDRAIRHIPIESVIYLSSVDVYGLPPELPIVENTPLSPSSYYGLAKLSSEYILRESQASATPLTILRLSGVYGPGDQGRSTVGKLLKQLKKNGAVNIRGDGSALRDYVQVGDVCRLIHHFLMCPYNGLVNVATGQSLSVREVVTILAETMKISSDLRFTSDSPTPERDLVFDVRQLNDVVPGFKFVDTAQGVCDYAEGV